ncbi:MAG: hypothetical protein M3R51_03295 [Candidatus Eremiobacteraeota bacterium]|nr:hypothetical protein [Candidatus Eremiobacteraeota bacterium]
MANEQHSIATYVSDMLALERHIRIPFDTQQKDDDFNEYSDSAQLVTRLSALSNTHIDQLKQCLSNLGGHEMSPIKSAVVEVEGAVAGAIDKMRKTKVSKALRDDYTALALCSAGYTALVATANGLGDMTVSGLAQRLLGDYAQMIMEIGEALPAVVVQELRATGLDIDTATSETSRSQVSQAWRSGARDVASTSTTRGSVETAPQSSF